METPSLNDLLTVPDQDTVLDQEVLPELQKRGVRATDWLTGSVQRAQAYLIALMRVSVRLAIAALCAAGFEDYVFGFATPPPNPDGSIIDVTGWAPYVAKQRYGANRIDATYTRRKILLTNTSASAYGPLAKGAIILLFPSGNRYILDEQITIPASGSVTAIFRSEFATDSSKGIVYIDSPTSSPITLVTAQYSGVTATNPYRTYSGISQVGSGLGTLNLTNTPTTTHTVAMRIESTGRAADNNVAWSTSLDGGSWTLHAAGTNSITNLGGFNIDIALNDNAGNPAFVAGTVYYFTSHASDVTEVGRDIETPQELGRRCRALWPSLAFAKDSSGNIIPVSPTISAYEALARAASDQVKVCFVQTGSVLNEVKIYIAGQGALLGSDVIATVQTFLDSRSMITDVPVVASPTGRAITLAGLTVTVKASLLATAQASLRLALQNYLGGVDSKAELGVNGRVDYDYIIALVRTTTGVTKVSGTLTINGAAADLQLPVTASAFEIATWAQQVSSAFTWVTA